MIKRDEIINFINKTLGIEQDKDPYLFNGLHVVGNDQVNKIALGVSDNLELFTKAAKWEADIIIVHHGMFGPKKYMPIDKVVKKRLKVLFDNNITLLGYHYYLDKHKSLGNNARIIKLLGADIGKDFGYLDGLSWGWEASYKNPISITTLIQKCKSLCGDSVTAFSYGPKLVKRFGIISGGGPSNLTEAIAKHLDAYLTGEPKEWTKEWAKEAGIHFIYLGHYNSEKFGVMALGEVLKKKFPQLEIKFIEVPNNL